MSLQAYIAVGLLVLVVFVMALSRLKRRRYYVAEGNRRKFTGQRLVCLPLEIVEVFSRLPRRFRMWDMNRLLGDRTTRSMMWRYLQRLETLGLIRHTSKIHYLKLYDRVSDWIEKDLLVQVSRIEFRATQQRSILVEA